MVMGLEFSEGSLTHEGGVLALLLLGGRVEKNGGELLLGSVERVRRVEVVVGGGGGGGGRVVHVGWRCHGSSGKTCSASASTAREPWRRHPRTTVVISPRK